MPNWDDPAHPFWTTYDWDKGEWVPTQGNLSYFNRPIPVKPADNTISKVDWRDAKYSTPVKNQGSCGSCWAFTATVVYESMIAITTGNAPVRLSEQEYTNCVRGGCNGGWYETAWSYSFEKGGQLSYTDLPYVGNTLECKNPEGKRSLPPKTNRYTAPKTATDIKLELAKGPLAVAVSASGGFGSYKSGIFKGPCEMSINHAVVMVGWGFD